MRVYKHRRWYCLCSLQMGSIKTMRSVEYALFSALFSNSCVYAHHISMTSKMPAQTFSVEVHLLATSLAYTPLAWVTRPSFANMTFVKFLGTSFGF